MLLFACSAPTPALPPLSSEAPSGAQWDGTIRPVPAPRGLDARKVEIGRRLFSDRILSLDRSTSCATCHPLERAGVDGLPRSVGFAGALGDRNTPTVYNTGLNHRQFWDGRAASLENQIDGPITNPRELATSWPVIVERIGAVPEYRRAFANAYSDGVSAANIRTAIASFERSLVYLNSPFDQYLLGNSTAITPEEREGYERFRKLGCASCHQGANVGGNMFERLGVVRKYQARPACLSSTDEGRLAVTGRPEDRFVFRVPSLRLVTLTSPYLHNGCVPTLEETIQIMANDQLGRDLSPADVSLIARFLDTLVGRPAEIIGAPGG